MAVKSIIQAIPLTSLGSGSVSGTYAAINSAGLPNPCSILRIINNSNKDVTVSFDGINDHEFVPTLTSVHLSLQSNAQPNTLSAVIPQGTIVYIKGTTGTGTVYLVGYFQPSNNS
jgi:hypothetical protein